MRVFLKYTQTNSSASFALLMLFGVFLASVSDVLGKILMDHSVSPMTLIAVRGMISSVFVIFTLSLMKRKTTFLTTSLSMLPHHIVRGITGFFAFYLFLDSLHTVNLAEATSLQMSYVIMLAGLSVVFDNRKLSIFLVLGLLLGLLGVLLITKPTFSVGDFGHIQLIGSSLLLAVLIFHGKWLVSKESSYAASFYYFFFSGIIAIVVLLLKNKVNELFVLFSKDIILLIFFSVLSIFSSIFKLQSLSQGNVAALSTLEYTSIIWAIIFGVVWWDDQFSFLFFVGASFIIGSSFLIQLTK